MPLETNPELLSASTDLWRWLGGGSLVGLLSLFAAWLKFRPELGIEGTVNHSKTLSAESRLRIKNLGALPALDIKADVTNFCAQVGGITFKDNNLLNFPAGAKRISGGETVEISVTPGVSIQGAFTITEFSYDLKLRYSTKLFLFTKHFSKQWRIELRPFQGGYAWHFKQA